MTRRVGFAPDEPLNPMPTEQGWCRVWQVFAFGGWGWPQYRDAGFDGQGRQQQRIDLDVWPRVQTWMALAGAVPAVCWLTDFGRVFVHPTVFQQAYVAFCALATVRGALPAQNRANIGKDIV